MSRRKRSGIRFVSNTENHYICYYSITYVMSKPAIKSLPFALAVALCVSLVPEEAAAQSRKAEKQRAEELSYQQAGGASADRKDREWVDPNATIVRGTPRSRLSPAEQLAFNLNQRKAELQEQVDLLGAELKTARGTRARKITKELDILADQIAVIDRKLEALPKPQTIPEAYSSGKPFKQFVDALVDKRIEEEGYVKGPSDTPATDNYTAPARNTADAYRVVYRVQLAVTSYPNEGAFAAFAWRADVAAAGRQIRLLLRRLSDLCRSPGGLQTPADEREIPGRFRRGDAGHATHQPSGSIPADLDRPVKSNTYG